MLEKIKTLLTTKNRPPVLEAASHETTHETTQPETTDILPPPTKDVSKTLELTEDIPLDPEAISAFFDGLADSIDFVVPDSLGKYALKDELLLGLKIVATISGVLNNKDDTPIDKRAKEAGLKVIVLIHHFGAKKVVAYATDGHMIFAFLGRQLIRFFDGSSPDFVDRLLISLVKKLQSW